MENIKIYKYPLKIEDSQIINMPSNAHIMDIQMQNSQLVMWAMVDVNSELIQVNIKMYGTGMTIDDTTEHHEYLATVQNENLVWHFFMAYEK